MNKLEKNIMQKTAQKRSILNKLREMSNVSGIAAENFFSPQFQEVMENLRTIDANIRSIATGQQIEGADPDPGQTGDTTSLKDLLKSAKSNFNRREYMTAVAELGRFHKKFFDITVQIKNLHNKVDQVHHKFLFQDLDEDHKKELKNLKTRFSAEQRLAIIKEASVMDFFYNIGTKRGRALAFYEKRYPKQISRLKKDTANLLAKSEGLLGQLLSSLKEMASARATRNVDKYMGAANKVERTYDNYDKTFKDYYTTNIKGFLEVVFPTEEKPEAATDVSPTGTADNSKQPTIHPEPSEYGTSDPESIPIDLTNPKFPKDPNMPTNIGPTIPPPPDTVREMSPPSGMETSPPTIPPGIETSPPTVPLAQKGPVQWKTPAKGQRAQDIPAILPSKSTMTNMPIPVPTPTIPDVLAPSPSKNSSHYDFIRSLESLSNEDPIILSSYIKKYANAIQNKDPEVAIKLLQIVKSIKA
jgi:hypothetical protein